MRGAPSHDAPGTLQRHDPPAPPVSAARNPRVRNLHCQGQSDRICAETGLWDTNPGTTGPISHRPHPSLPATPADGATPRATTRARRRGRGGIRFAGAPVHQTIGHYPRAHRRRWRPPGRTHAPGGAGHHPSTRARTGTAETPHAAAPVVYDARAPPIAHRFADADRRGPWAWRAARHTEPEPRARDGIKEPANGLMDERMSEGTHPSRHRCVFAHASHHVSCIVHHASALAPGPWPWSLCSLPGPHLPIGAAPRVFLARASAYGSAGEA